MAKTVLHESLIIERKHVTITTTLCRRVDNSGNDMNVAVNDEQVTCKLCLKKMDQLSKRKQAEKG